MGVLTCMKMYLQKKTVSRLLLFVFLLLAACSPPAFASATTEVEKPERMYLISESEVRTLQSSLTRLKSNNEKLQTDLTSLRSELQKSRERSLELEKQLSKQTEQLNQLREQSRNQETSLTNANESFKAWSAEEKQTRLRIKRQRNTWEAVSGVLVVLAACK